MTKRFFLAATALLGLATTSTVLAQQSVDLIMDNFTSSVLSQTTTTLNNQMVMSAYHNPAYRTPATYNAGKAAGSKSSPAATVRAVSTAYAPTAAARQEALTAQSTKDNRAGAAAQQFVAIFGPGGSADYTGLYRKVLAGSGLRENDVADAYAAYLTATYQVAHGASPLVPASAAAVRAQFAPAVGRVAAGKSATTLAALGEYLKLQTALLYVGNQQSTTTFRQNVARTLNERFHLDVMVLTLTSKGFVKK